MMTIKLPGEDWYGETHDPLALETGILWIPTDLDACGYTHFVTEEDEAKRDLANEALVAELLEILSKPIERTDE